VWVAQHVLKQKDERADRFFETSRLIQAFSDETRPVHRHWTEFVSRVSALCPSYRRASFLDTHLHAYTMASIAKFSVAPKVAAARHGRFAGSRVSKVRPPTRDSGIARRGHVFG